MPDDKKVDESWKEKAKSEKEPSDPAPKPALKGGDSPASEPTGASPSGPSPTGAEGSPSGPPPAEFPSLVASLATSALMALGGDSEAEGKPGAPDLDRARYAIDMLDVLAAKTKGNLTPGEDRHLATVLHQLRLAFVQASKKPPAG